MKKSIIKFKYKFLNKVAPNFISSELYINYLKILGLKIGKGTVIFNPQSVTIDCSRPVLLSIGQYCKITQGVVILTHDYSRSVLRRVYGDIVAEAKKTVIGDNVFIGINSVILMGTQIGDNCIIGAGSICHGNYPANSLIAGNPAKVISSLDNYYKKRKTSYVKEAKEYAKYFQEMYYRNPTINEMGAFFPLFLIRDNEELIKNNINTKLSGDEEQDIIDVFLKSEPIYDSFDQFLKELDSD